MACYLECVLIIVIDTWVASTYADKCESNPVKLNSTYFMSNNIQGFVFPQIDLANNYRFHCCYGHHLGAKEGRSQRATIVTLLLTIECAWVIIASNPKDVIKFQMTDWFRLHQPNSCSKGSLVFRDGPGEYSPEIRVVCGVPYFKEEMSTSSNSLFIQFNIYNVDDGSCGFALEYWSENNHPTVAAIPVYETMNYVLMFLSVCVIIAFTSGIIYLLIREKRREQRVLKVKLKRLLQQRRKAISGPAEHSYYEQSNSDLHTSRTDMTSFVESSLTPSSDITA